MAPRWLNDAATITDDDYWRDVEQSHMQTFELQRMRDGRVCVHLSLLPDADTTRALIVECDLFAHGAHPRKLWSHTARGVCEAGAIAARAAQLLTVILREWHAREPHVLHRAALPRSSLWRLSERSVDE